MPIPIQKEIVHKSIAQHWAGAPYVIVDELEEAGVSGFKVSEKNRDILQKVKQRALRKEFDVYAVYHSDRIGRIFEEGPMVVSFLNKAGIDVWSALEGDINSRTSMEKLMTSIRFWSNENESLKQSKRSTDYHIIKVENGEWRGGDKVPYGYKLVDKGEKNFKGRHILSFIINGEESRVVTLIYELSIDYNFGANRIAGYLNKRKISGPSGGPWYASTIYYILTNPVYKGYFHAYFEMYEKEIESKEQIERLIIIPEDRWDLNQQKMAARKQPQHNRYQPKTNHGKMLLSGIAYCGHCGSRLTTQTVYRRWTTKDGVKHKEPYHRYRCGSFYRMGGVECDGQSTYGSVHIDTSVVNAIKDFLLSVSVTDLNEAYVKSMKEREGEYKKECLRIQDLIQKKRNEIKTLQGEIYKAVSGESVFSEEDLADQIKTAKKELLEAEQVLLESRAVFENNKPKIASLPTYEEWSRKFEKATFDQKKALIGLIVEKVVVFIDRIEISIKISEEMYREFIACNFDQSDRVLA